MFLHTFKNFPPQMKLMITEAVMSRRKAAESHKAWNLPSFKLKGKPCRVDEKQRVNVSNREKNIEIANIEDNPDPVTATQKWSTRPYGDVFGSHSHRTWRRTSFLVPFLFPTYPFQSSLKGVRLSRRIKTRPAEYLVMAWGPSPIW